MMDFSLPGRHLVARAAVDDLHGLRPEPHRGPGRVHGDVAGAEDHHVFSLRDRGVDIRILIGPHQIGPGQVLVCREDADQVLAGQIHEFRQTRSDADIDRVVSDLEQFVERNGPADHGIALDIYPEPGEKIHLLGDNGLGQAELGDAVDQDPAGFMEGLENGDLMSFGDQVAGHGEA